MLDSLLETDANRQTAPAEALLENFRNWLRANSANYAGITTFVNQGRIGGLFGRGPGAVA